MNDLRTETVEKEAGGSVAEKSPSRGAKATEALQISSERTRLNTTTSDTCIDGDVSHGHRRRETDEASHGGGDREVPPERDGERGNRSEGPGGGEVRAAAEAGEGTEVGEEAPEGLHDPWEGVEAGVELHGGGAGSLDVFPVIVGDDSEEGAREPVVESVHQYDSRHERRAQPRG